MADLIPFPQDRNIGKARVVAHRWLQKSWRARESYWSTTVNRMAFVMQRIGFDDAEIARQVDAFQRAVQTEIDFTTDVFSTDRTPQERREMSDDIGDFAKALQERGWDEPSNSSAQAPKDTAAKLILLDLDHERALLCCARRSTYSFPTPATVAAVANVGGIDLIGQLDLLAKGFRRPVSGYSKAAS